MHEGKATLYDLIKGFCCKAFEAQYQQRLVPPGGAMFKRDWLNYYDILPAEGDETTIYQSWDSASKTGPENDWSVGTTWMFRSLSLLFRPAANQTAFLGQVCYQHPAVAQAFGHPGFHPTAIDEDSAHNIPVKKR